MPTGSLCAERNVIGSALADDITLKRQDLKIIAVYAGSMAHAAAPPPVDASPDVIVHKAPGLFVRSESVSLPLSIDSEAINAEYQPAPGLMGSPGSAAGGVAPSAAPAVRQLHRSASEGSSGPRSPLPSSKRKILEYTHGSSEGRQYSFDEGNSNSSSSVGAGPMSESPSTPSAKSYNGSSSGSDAMGAAAVKAEAVPPTTPRAQSPRTTRSGSGGGAAGGQFLPPTGRGSNGSSSSSSVTVSGGKKRNRTIAFKTTQSSDVLSSLAGGAATLCLPVNGSGLSSNTNTESSIGSLISSNGSASGGGIAAVTASVTHIKGSDLVACTSQTFAVDENDINPLKVRLLFGVECLCCLIFYL